jgi:hypothetical protein
MKRTDPIVGQVRKVRDEYAASLGFDVRLIAEDLRKSEHERNARTRGIKKPVRGTAKKRRPAA